MGCLLLMVSPIGVILATEHWPCARHWGHLHALMGLIFQQHFKVAVTTSFQMCLRSWWPVPESRMAEAGTTGQQGPS